MNPKVLDFVATFALMFQQWATRVVGGNFADPISTRPSEEKLFFIDWIRKEVAIVERLAAQGLLSSMPLQQNSLIQRPTGDQAAFCQCDGPGTLSLEGPRHSNGGSPCVYV